MGDLAAIREGLYLRGTVDGLRGVFLNAGPARMDSAIVSRSVVTEEPPDA
jgi:hypothetical protein